MIWVVTLCSDALGYHRFRELCCLHFHRPENLQTHTRIGLFWNW